MNRKFEKFADQVRVLGNPLRLKIIQLLNDRGEMSVTAIYNALDAEQSLVSHNLEKLFSKDVVKRRRAGKHIFYSLDADNKVVNLLIPAIPHEDRPVSV